MGGPMGPQGYPQGPQGYAPNPYGQQPGMPHMGPMGMQPFQQPPPPAPGGNKTVLIIVGVVGLFLVLSVAAAFLIRGHF